jgi:peptide/nickel transport system substrate-binding protein
MKRTTWIAAAMLAAGLAMVAQAPAQAKTLRWAAQNDLLTFDPHAQNHQTTLNFQMHVYEALTRYTKDYQVEGALATTWQQVTPTQWRFNLRRGVKFHDGTPFTADDVVFSYNRASTPPSNMTSATTGIKEVKKIDDFTVELILTGPNPVLLRQIIEARIMSRAWSEKNKVEKAQDYKAKEETFAARNANGTGPYLLKTWQADVKIELTLNKNWWDKMEGNVDEVVFTPVKSDGTRVAALLSGDVDIITDPPPQDVARLRQTPALKVLDGGENRTIFFGMDQFRDELQYSSVKGKNPLKDRRVRLALHEAIDADAIKRTLMRGLSIPAGMMIAPQVHGWAAELDKRPAVDVEGAKKLLADAGYPSGFEVTLDCPNNRYVNDEEICQAVASMWAKIGVKARLNAMPFATYIPKILKFDTSIYMLGWGVSTFDALYSLQALQRTVDPKGGADGSYNLGRYSNPKVDALIDGIKIETDVAKRDAMIRDVYKLLNDEVAYLPIHHQIRPWAMKTNVTTVHRADDRQEAKWVRID